MYRAPLLLLVAALLSTMATPVSAQRGGTGGFSGSSFGGGGMGMSGMSGMSMGGMGGGMGGMGGGMGGFGSGMGMGGMGSGMGMGGMGGGMGGFGSGMSGGFGQSGMNGMQSGQQSFIGRDNNDMANVFRQMGRGSNQFFQQLNRTLGRGRGRNNSSQEENAALAVRVRVEPAFDGPRIQPTVAASNVRTRLATTLTRRSIAIPEVELSGDTVILRGVAQSESQRMVIEQLARMEPGVLAVENQMTVADPSDTQPTAPAPKK